MLNSTYSWLELQLWLSVHMPGFSHLRLLGEGHQARVYGLHYQGQDRVLRLSDALQAFVTEMKVFPALHQRGVLLPPIYEVGEWKHGYYAVSAYISGRTGYGLSLIEGVQQLLPGLLSLHQWRPGASLTRDLLVNDVYRSQEWSEFIFTPLRAHHSMTAQTQALMYRHVPLYRLLIEQMAYFSSYGAEWSADVWVHGDLHSGNFLSDGVSLRALLDWAALRQGDPTFDWAKLFLLSPDLAQLDQVLEQILVAYAAVGMPLKDVYIRLLLGVCHHLYKEMIFPLRRDELFLQRALHNGAELIRYLQRRGEAL